MVKTSLPVILLRGAVLLPYCEFRLELTEDTDKRILELSQENYDNNVLIISPSNPIEEVINYNELTKIGTVAKISMKMEIGNFTRILLEGINRVNVDEYIDYPNEKGIIDAVISSTTQFAMSPTDEIALTRKLLRRVDAYSSKVPHVSNSILAQISEINSISKISDIVANYLPIEFERKMEYLKTLNPYKRVIMLFEDIKTEEEILELDKKIESKLKDSLDKSQREYILKEKIKLIKEELGEVDNKEKDIETLKEKISSLKCNERVKDKLYDEVRKYELMNVNSPEMGIVRNYIELMLSLPWGTKSKESKDLISAREKIDETHYGLEKVKDRIIEFLAVKQLSNNVKSTIICLVGPPGVGKTSLARSIAESINRKFVKMSVGGVNDESEIVGHRRTYLGASPGKIITSLKRAKTNNPVFLIDEVDKMTKDIKGDPASALLEVLDPEQNKYFIDSYIEEEFDLSDVMFILTANNLYQIPDALRDRLEVIEISGYTEYEKLDIAKKHLLKNELINNGLSKYDIKITDEVIMLIIRNYTREAGVRELERQIAAIYRKIATEIVNKKAIKKNIINEKNIEQYLGKKKYLYNENENEMCVGVVNGLAYTEYGGAILPIEVTYYSGKGNLILTGSLGNVMKESAQIALSYIKSNYKEYKIDKDIIDNSDIHIHVPEGAIPKDGPSAGVTLITALISMFTNKAINKNIGMTGEITLRGNILPIGGLKDKIIGAHRGGIKTIFIPKKNEKDIDDIPKEIQKDIKLILVDDYKEIYKEVFKK